MITPVYRHLVSNVTATVVHGETVQPDLLKDIVLPVSIGVLANMVTNGLQKWSSDSRSRQTQPYWFLVPMLLVLFATVVLFIMLEVSELAVDLFILTFFGSFIYSEYSRQQRK